MAKSTAKEKAAVEPGFEASMARLEEVVEAMQSPELPLDQVIARYEEGMKLIAACSARLEAAEQKIELLTREKSGKFTPAAERAGSDAPPEDDLTVDSESGDEARLF